LEKLFFHGRVLISERRGFRRVYDLPEKVLPASVLAQPEPTPTEIARFLALAKVRWRKLALLKKAELNAVRDDVIAVEIPGCPTAHILPADVPLLERIKAGELSPPSPQPLLLAPLDPVVYDRRLTSKLWDFDYTWEAYTPIHKRVRGHFSLPVLVGLEIVGTVDPKADRAKGRLAVGGRRLRRGTELAREVDTLAAFLSLKGPRRTKPQKKSS
jgi:uncharacterized protein YcaQ